MTEPLVRRRDAAEATLREFERRPFKWGRADCARMTAAHLRRLGYKVVLPPSGSYGTALAAAKALKARGYADLPAALDDMGLERIAPAAAIVGDVLQLAGEDVLGALCISLGNGRLLGYHDDAPLGAAVLQPMEYVTAWRANPRS